MLRYNFRPSLVDHTQLMVLVRSFYNCSDQDHNFVLRKLGVFNYATIKDSERKLLLKFTKGYNRDVLEWGKIQLHRRPLGFIGVACLSNDPVQQPKDYERIVHRFDNLISQYTSFLYDSRCIIVGPENPAIKNTRKDVIYLSLSEVDIGEQFIQSITEFISSLFVILESKRVEKASENFDRMVMPSAPCEQEQTVSDTDTRQMKRKCLGRNKKILADLCLLSGLYPEALVHYSNSVEHLRNVNDYLWMGAALEGACAVSNIMSLGDQILRPPSNKLNRQSRSLTIDQTNIQINVPADNAFEEQLKNVTIFNNTELISKYSECLSCFKRFNTGPMEMESHFKFIRALIHMQKKLEVAQVVQCLLQLPLNLNEMEKIDFASVLSSIHEQLSLHRKAAFYRRQAAMCYVQNNPGKSALAKAMSYLQEVCPAYKLQMEQPTNIEKKQDVPKGWSSIQLIILLDMLQITRGLGNKLDSVRLLCFILERYAGYLNQSNHSDLSDLLEEFSDDTSPLVNENSKDDNVQLIRPLPIIRDFHAKTLAHHLQPLKKKKNQVPGPFIFSALSVKKKDKEDIIWVCGDVSEVAMVVDNPLPAEIKVNKMTLITEGTEFEAHPATLALPADSGSFPFMLLGTPTKPGSLTIKGYRVEVLGISNVVLLPTPIVIEVTPMLPILKLNSTLPRAPNSSSLNPEDKHYQTLFTSANLYRGHSCTGQITLENAGKVPVTKLDIKLSKPKEANVIFKMEQVTEKLPLQPGDSIHLDVVIMPEDSWKLYNNQDKIEPMLIMSYSCQEGEEGGYTREISWVTVIKVMPSLEFSNLELFEIERQPDFCLVCFDVENMTSVSMNVEGVVQITDPEVDTSEFQDSLEKLEILLESKKNASVEVKFPRISLPPPKNRRQTIEDIYEKLVRQSICLKWRLSDTNYSGVTYFQNMKITPEMVPVLKPKHLNINIKVNDNRIQDGELISIPKDSMINISVVLTNFHELDLDDMTLHVNPYQRCHRSVERMNQLCLPSGIMNKGVKKLTPGETFEHSCGLLFLYEGEFMIDISCSANRKFGTPTPKRQRAFAIGEHAPNSPSSATSDKKMSWTTPLSPGSVSKKLKYHEADFWAQTFVLNVS